MTDQLTMDFDTRTKSRKKFDAFNEKNPRVVEILEILVRRYLNKGATRIGINHICEVARYEVFFETQDPNSMLKLSHAYNPHFADELIRRNPEWDNVIVRRARWAK